MVGETSTSPAYRLSAELRAHGADVKGVAASPSGNRVASASRDSTVAVWDISPSEELLPSAPFAILRGHEHFVNAVTFVDDDTVVSASLDKTVRVWSLPDLAVDAPSANGGARCVATLRGHTDNVCHVSVLSNSTMILTTSWDKTARVWDLRSRKCLYVLEGHTQAVWKGMVLQEGCIVTVAADKTVRLWKLDARSHPEKTSAVSIHDSTVLPSAHSDIVRSVAIGPGGQFATVANDSSLVYWSKDGKGSFSKSSEILNLHDGSFCYSLDGSREPDAGIATNSEEGSWLYASGGEDNAVRVVRASHRGAALEAIQTLMHPGVVWTVSICPNGDILSGCSDGVVRLFTRDPGRVAHPDVLQTYDTALSQRQLSTKVIGGVDVAKLPVVEDGLQAPGRKDGETKMVKTRSGSAEVYMWSNSDGKWSKVGDVVDGPGGGASLGSGAVNGKTYDYVFDVDLGQGSPNAKLGYNRGENPFTAAQRFIDDNDINQDFLDQIASFIEQQLPPDAAALACGMVASDPLTGGSRYVPGGTRGDSDGTGGGAPMRSNESLSQEAAATPSLPPPRKYIPWRDGVVIHRHMDAIEKIQLKLAEFNSQLAQDQSPVALTQEEAVVFGTKLMPKLKSRGVEPVSIEAEECILLEKMLSWPTAMVFPVLDVGRLVITQPSASVYFFGSNGGDAVVDEVLRHMGSADATAAVLITGCRFLCNMFASSEAAAFARGRMQDILSTAGSSAKSENRKAREAYASLLVNFAVSFQSMNASADARSGLFQVLTSLLEGSDQDEEVLFRLMVALGTLMCGPPDVASRGVQLGVVGATNKVAHTSARIQRVAVEIATLIAP